MGAACKREDAQPQVLPCGVDGGYLPADAVTDEPLLSGIALAMDDG